MNTKKSQSSVEMVLVISISLGVIMGILLLIQSYISVSTNNALSNQINNIGLNMADNANLISLYGYPARIEVEYFFPDNINNISVFNQYNNNTIYFNVSFSGYTSTFGFDSNAKINVTLNKNDFLKGKKYIVFEYDKSSDFVIIKRNYKE
jgi:hypothetical protein